MSAIQTPKTYVLYADSTSGENKLAVSEENSFESYSNDHADKVQEIARQVFLFPVVASSSDSDDLAELIPDTELRLSFVNKAVNAKLVLHVNKVMKDAEQVKTKNEDGEESVSLRPNFVAVSTPIDLTDIVGAPPRRERLTQDVKIKRLLGDMTPDQQAEFLRSMLAALEQDAASE